MNDERKSEIFSFDSKLNKDGGFDIPKTQLKEMFEKGYSGIKVLILSDSKKAAVENGYQLEIFEKIQNTQSLPESVVLDFLRSKGSIKTDL